MIVVDSSVHPILESQGGDNFRFGVDYLGSIYTDEVNDLDDVERIVLESPDTSLHELLVDNSGSAYTVSPPNPSYPDPVQIYAIYEHTDIYEIQVSDLGVLSTRKL